MELFKKNKKYGYFEPKEDEHIQDWIILTLKKRDHFDYTCVKRGLIDIIIEEGLEGHIRTDSCFRKCYYCDGQNVICDRYEPLKLLINFNKNKKNDK